MSITAKDLQDIFDGLGKAFQPGDVNRAAQAVGGRVIEDTPSVTRNARDMTALLAGAGPQAYRGTATGNAKTFAEQMGRGSSGGEPTGSRGRPFTVELSQSTAINLAKEIGKAAGKDKPQQSGLEKFLSGFSHGSAATRPYRPLARLHDWASGRVKDYLGLGDKGKQAPVEPPLPNAVMELAKRNAARIAEKAKPGYQIPLTRDPFGSLQGLTDEAIAGRQKQNKLRQLEKPGMAGGKGFSSIMKGPPPAGGAAAISGAAQGGEAAGLAASGGEAAAGLAGLAGAAGEAAGMMIPVVGEVIGVVTAVVGVAAAMKSFADATIDGNRELAKWNGQLAGATAREQIADIRREGEMASATGGGAADLQNEMTKLRDEWQPIAQDLAIIKNTVAEAFVEVLRIGLMSLKVLETLAGGPLLRALDKYLHGDSKDLPLKDLFDFMKGNARLANVRNPQAVHGQRAVRPGGAGQGGGMGPGPAMPAGPRAVAPAAPALTENERIARAIDAGP